VPASLPRRELIRRLRAFGFDGPFAGGKHQYMIRGRLKLRVPNPHGADLSVGLVQRIIRQAGISDSNWDNWETVIGT
jgi:predicted RNA binding protein YcfA (HicA-like mRNA interferase family)